MKFNFDSAEPVKPEKDSSLHPSEKALIIIGVGAAIAIILVKILAVVSNQLAEAIFPSLF
jgi:hypothetical protein